MCEQVNMFSSSEFFASNKQFLPLVDIGSNSCLKSNSFQVECPIMNKFSDKIVMDSSAILTPTSPQGFPEQFIQLKSNDYLRHQVFSNNDTISTCASMHTDAMLNYTDNSINWYGISSLTDTPNSAHSTLPSTQTTAKTHKEDVFNFEPEYIENFQRYCEHDKTTEKNLDNFVNIDKNYIEYVNYNESKLSCESPNFEWSINNADSSISPKPLNFLPPISSINSSGPLQDVSVEQNNFDAIDAMQAPIKLEYDVDSMEYFNFDGNNITDKTSHEEKNIWDTLLYETKSLESPTENTFFDGNGTDENDMSGYEQNDVMTPPIDAAEYSIVNDRTWTCQWENCYLPFHEQSELVKHIEKMHIEARKGDVFSCYWMNCARQHKPFNARYKLLIHMRVHSGEKPNKCQVNIFSNVAHLSFAWAIVTIATIYIHVE